MRILLLVFLLCSLNGFGQFKYREIGFSYAYSHPTGMMQQTIRQAHGLMLDFYLSPANQPIAIGLEASYNFYGEDRSRQDYTFDNGTMAPMDVVVSNNFANVLLAGRYYLRHGSVQPYLTGKLGYSIYFTQLNIYDPNDWDDCAPVESEVLKRDGAWIAVAGAGVQWDVARKRNPGVFIMNLSVNYTTGGEVSYMSVNATNHSHATHTSDVYAQFINTQTKITHEHHVGNVYSSWLQMMDARLGFAMRINRTASRD